MLRYVVGAIALVGCFLGISIVFGSFYTIDQGERGVILRFGSVSGIAEPGFNYKLPFADSVKEISIRSISRLYEGEPMISYSADQQPADIRLSVTYRIQPDRVADVYVRYGGEEGLVSRLLDRQVFEEAKIVFGTYNASTAIQERGRLNAEVAKAIQKGVGTDAPLIVESVQIEDISFSAAYEKSVEDRMLAEVEVARLRQNAEREKVQAEITVTQAQAQADAVRAQAQAEAEAIKIKGLAEAEAISARGKALQDNPGLVQLIQAEKWNGTLPTTMVPNSTLPMLSMGAVR